MEITRVTIEGVGRFHSQAHIDGLGEGVNVLAAGNEAGKSTFFRALRACLFSRHDSQSQDIKDLCNADSQLPATIHLEFILGGKFYEIRKSFLRSPSASLICDGREIARFKQADEAVWDLLRISPGSGRTLDQGAFGLLWVEQSASFRAPVVSDNAASALNAAIEAEVGAVVGGERARQIVEDVGSEIKRVVTEKQRPKANGPLDVAIQELQKWEELEAKSQAKLDALDQQFTELLELRRRRDELTDKAAAEQLGQEFLSAKKAVENATLLTQELGRLEAEQVSAKRNLEGAANRLSQFRELTGRIDGNRRSESTLAASLEEYRARELNARAELHKIQDQIALAANMATDLSVREQQLTQLETASRRAREKDELTRKLSAVEQLSAVLLQLDAQLTQIGVTTPQVEDLEAIARDLASLNAQLKASAARLSVAVKPGAPEVFINQTPVKGTLAGPVVKPARVTVGDLAEITITPAPNPTLEEQQALKVKLSSGLTALGVPTIATARALLAQRHELETARKGIISELRIMKISDNNPAQAIGGIRKELAHLDAFISAALRVAKRQTLPSAGELEQEKLNVANDRSLLETKRASLEALRMQHQPALEAAVEERSATESHLELIRKALADDVSLCPDSERAARLSSLLTAVTESQTAYQTAEAQYSAKEQSVPNAAEIERVQSRCRRLEQAIENQKNELLQLEGDVGRLTGQIQNAGGDGIGETFESAREQRALAERECTRITNRVAALQLLRDTIASCLAEGQAQYYEPVRRSMRPFLHDLFPGAEIELGDGFEIAGIKRSLVSAEMFHRLSDGTQEQIAILVRLALGAMLVERGHVVPIILDDALVYCDDDRINRMFDALTRAGKGQQVIVLTCRLRAFSSLGGRPLRIVMNPAQPC